MKHFTKLPLTLAVAYAISPHALAAPSANLGTEQVTVRQGAKVKTNVVTTALKNERTESDLRGLLKEEPAIEFGGGTGTSQYIAVRGMGQNSVDLKIDNAHTDTQILYHQGRFMLDPSLVKIVSIQKGAGAASAGIGATNGAIIAKTVDAQDLLQGLDQDQGVKVSAGFGSNSAELNYGVQAFGKKGAFDYVLAANINNEGDYEVGGKAPYNGSKRVPYSALDKTNYLAKVGATQDNHKVSLSHMRQVHDGVRTIREEFSVDDDPDALVTTNRQMPVYRKTTQDNTNLEWSAHDLAPNLPNATANAYLIKNTRFSADDEKNGYAGNIKGATTTVIDTKGLNTNLDWDVQGTTVKTGINYRIQEVTPDRFFSEYTKGGQTIALPPLNKPQKTDVGVYVEAIKDFNIDNVGAVTTTLGARYDRFDFKAMDGKTVKGDAISPSLGVIYQPTAVPSLTLNANHSYATRSPRLYDALLSHGKRGIVSIADGTKAETAKNSELGFNYLYAMGSGANLGVNGGIFYQRIDDAVVNPQDRHGHEGVREIANRGHITNKGFELGANYTQDGFTATVGVAQNDPKFHVPYSGTEQKVDINPEFGFPVGRTWTAQAGYRFAAPNLEIGARHRKVETSKGTLVVPSNEKVVREGYDVTDLYANWKPHNNNRLNVNLAVNNVFNKRYYPHSHRVELRTPKLPVLPAAGRDVRLGVNYTF